MYKIMRGLLINVIEFGHTLFYDTIRIWLKVAKFAREPAKKLRFCP